LSLILSIVVAILLSRSITRPLIAMTEASARIAQGDYGQAIPANGEDEVARLADSFNRMAREVERSQQAQRDFLANVSHDLKTPLTSMQGFSQAMLEGAIHDEHGYRRAAQIINEETERMGQLIQQLLDLARLDAGEAIQERVPVAPGKLVQRVVDKLAPVATEAQLELRSLVAPDLPTLEGDDGRLEQALANVVDNAIKYSQAGGRIEIGARAVTAKRGQVANKDRLPCALPHLRDGCWVAIQVKDTGMGISAQDLPHLFERFYRADKSRGPASGSGLGLAITKEIIEAHGGVIGVSSEQGSGSCFCILLPSGPGMG
jgi:signal transduction histidine kinase